MFTVSFSGLEWGSMAKALPFIGKLHAVWLTAAVPGCTWGCLEVHMWCLDGHMGQVTHKKLDSNAPLHMQRWMRILSHTPPFWKIMSSWFTNFNKEAIWLYAELFLGYHDGSCYGLWWFVVIHVMLCAGFCHGSWWFISWFVVICSDLWFVVIHVMVNLWWFVVICDDSCHHL